MGIYQISLNVFKILRRKKMSSYQEVFDIEINSDIKNFFSNLSILFKKWIGFNYIFKVKIQ